MSLRTFHIIFIVCSIIVVVGFGFQPGERIAVAFAGSQKTLPVGVLLAVLGYAIGTYGAWLCGQLMRVVAGG